MDQIQKLTALLLLATMLVAFSDAKNVVVGGSNKWGLGPNYAGWAAGAGPFKVGDSLVFSYGGKGGKNAVAHNVYLMKDMAHYQKCDFSGAVLLADPSKGASGFKYTIKQKKPHYFACSVANGFHCQAGMKFIVSPR